MNDADAGAAAPGNQHGAGSVSHDARLLSERDCWIFDMDGTLTVSVHDFDAIRDELGLPPGEPILELLAGLPEDEAAPLVRQLDDIELRLAREAQAGVGVDALLSELHARGTRMGILTRNARHIAYETLRTCGLHRYFESDFVIGREQAQPKPEPDGIHQLIDKWRRGPDDAVMVGDYYFDMAAGRAAGTATVYLDVDGSAEWSHLADVTVQRLDLLLGVI